VADTIDTAVELDEDVELTEYTSETPTPATQSASRPRRPRVPRPAAASRPWPESASFLAPASGRSTVARSRTYFPNKVHQQIVSEPFRVLELDGAYDVLVRVHGGGPSGQAGAVRLGVARSLNGVDEELNRPALKKAGFLTRDARVPERKKAGLKKARKAPQYSKR
jgi:small subunit ribosomal protein S9